MPAQTDSDFYAKKRKHLHRPAASSIIQEFFFHPIRTAKFTIVIGIFVLKILFSALLSGHSPAQQNSVVPIPYGNMDNWITRQVKESFVIGGKTQTLYEIADSRENVPENTPYINKISPWANSSVYARVSGITKGSATVFPEKRDGGYAAMMETKIETVKVFGIININVLASGTIFLGQVAEPITDTKNPMSKILVGIPFSGKPAYLQFDYKVITGGPNRKVNGLSKTGTATRTTSHAVAYIFLQKRWEDKEGNIYALRLGTGWEVFSKPVTTWQDQHRIAVHYGDITKEIYYDPKWGLKDGNEAYYTKNSKGRIVPIHEMGWGNQNDGVTHLFVQFSASDGGPFVGNTGSRFWVDNIGLVYTK